MIIIIMMVICFILSWQGLQQSAARKNNIRIIGTVWELKKNNRQVFWEVLERIIGGLFEHIRRRPRWHVGYDSCLVGVWLYSVAIQEEWPIICNQACKNRACGYKLHPITSQVIPQQWNKIFAVCNLCCIANGMFNNIMTIAYHHKKLWVMEVSNFVCLLLQSQSLIVWIGTSLTEAGGETETVLLDYSSWSFPSLLLSCKCKKNSESAESSLWNV